MEPPIAEDSIKKQKKPRKDSHKGKYRDFPDNDRRVYSGYHPLNVVVSLLGERYPFDQFGPHGEGHVNTLSESAAEIASNAESNHNLHHGERGNRQGGYPPGGIWNQMSQVSTLAEKMAEKRTSKFLFLGATYQWNISIWIRIRPLLPSIRTTA